MRRYEDHHNTVTDHVVGWVIALLVVGALTLIAFLTT